MSYWKSDEIAKGLKHLKKDKKLKPYLEKISLDVKPPTGDVYEGLISSIVSQQLSVKAAATIYDRFLALFSYKYPDLHELKEFSVEHLRTAGISRQKASYILNVAEYFSQSHIENTAWESIGDEEIIKELSSI